MGKLKPRHANQNVVVQLSGGTRRIMTREWYGRMRNYSDQWRIHVKLICVIPYPSPALFEH